MAISKWIFGVAQQSSSSSAASTQVGGPLVAAVSSADSKEFGLENVRASPLQDPTYNFCSSFHF
jgi:hypothetical protein